MTNAHVDLPRAEAPVGLASGTATIARPDTADLEEWMLRARCRGFESGVFFPSDGVGVEVAREICADCPVQVRCLEYALLLRIDHGVWGGASERERRRILRRRHLAATGEGVDPHEA
jgi:WhiB family redox-sensing transcriptional regulator